MKPAPPPFEGTEVTTCTLRLSGRLSERVGALDLDEDLYLLVRAVVTSIEHVEADTGTIERRHKAKAVAIVPYDAVAGAALLTEATAEADRRFGIVTLFTPGNEPEPSESPDLPGPASIAKHPAAKRTARRAGPRGTRPAGPRTRNPK
jgi:hypothetical protein